MKLIMALMTSIMIFTLSFGCANSSGVRREDIVDAIKIACSTAQAAAQVTPVLCKSVPAIEDKDAKGACQTAVLLLNGASVLCSQLKQAK